MLDRRSTETRDSLLTLRILRPLRLGVCDEFSDYSLEGFGWPSGRTRLDCRPNALCQHPDFKRYRLDQSNETLGRARPKLDIFANSFVLRDDKGWQITEGGRQFLASLEAPLPIVAQPVQAPEADMTKQPRSPAHRHFDLLLTTISSRPMAGSKDPRDDRPNPKNRAHGRSPAPPSRPGRGLRSAPMRWCRSAGFTTARKLRTYRRASWNYGGAGRRERPPTEVV